MTCKEKLMEEYAHLPAETIREILENECPCHYGYSEGHPDCSILANDSLCADCWDQEITEEKKEKENNTMATTKKTKEQLIEELEAAKNNIYELKKQLDNLERYKQYEDCADEIKAIHTAFMNSGFTNDQAFDLIKTAMQSVAAGLMKTDR